MSNRLESLEVTNDTVFKGGVYGMGFTVDSMTFSNYLIGESIIITGSEISNIENESISIFTNSSSQTDSAGDITLETGLATGTGDDGKLNFKVSGTTYQWPSTKPTANGQSLKVFSGGGTNSIVLEWA